MTDSQSPTPSRRAVLHLLGASAAGAVTGPAFADAVGLQDFGTMAVPLPTVTIFVARDIITMDPALPRAQAVAVVNSRIAALGTLEELKALVADQPHVIDETFRDKFLIAGFVEQHVHPVLAGLTMPSVVISIEPWDSVSGFSEQVRDPETYQTRLKSALAAHTDPEATFVTWGYHQVFHGPLDRAMLDSLAPDIPVVVWHRSCHEFYLNSKVMALYGIDAAFLASFTASEAAQADLGAGHFFEQAALKLLERLAPAVATPERLRSGLEFTVDYYHRNGITTACEPGGFYSKPLQQAINAVYSDDATPFNHYFIGDGKTFVATHRNDPPAMVAMAEGVLDWGEGRTRYLPDQVKFLTDGAIFSQLMQMKDGYTDGHEGAWIMDPDVFGPAFQIFWDADYQIHIHNNGDLGMDVLLDNLEQAQRRAPRYDHRTTIVHFGFATTEQVNRAARLGAIVSANPYYVTALAGRYKDVGIGPERSARMVPLGDAKAAGMSISLHSDMPMAPAKPLQLVWAATTRLTAEGEVTGPDQCIDIDTALRGITIDAAHSIRLETEIGSITPGKFANFTVLDQDPYAVPLTDLARIKVWGTVLEGRVQPAPAANSRAETAPAAPLRRFADATPAHSHHHPGGHGACDACGALRHRLSSLVADALVTRGL